MGIKINYLAFFNSLLGHGKKALLPQHDDSLTLARLFNEFFITKIDNIRHEFPILEQDLPIPSSIHFNAILGMNVESSLTYFNHTNIDEVYVLLSKMNKTTCMFDPFLPDYYWTFLIYLLMLLYILLILLLLLHHFLLHLNQLLSSHSEKNYT